MYSLLRENIDLLLKSISPANDVDPYVRIMRNVNGIDVSKDIGFQMNFRNYYRMNAAKLIDSFYKRFFEILEEMKAADDLNIAEIALLLYEKPNRANGKKTLQFSFASKLLHTIRPTEPVYDSMVASFYFLPQPQGHWNIKRKLINAIENYDFIKSEHIRVLDDGLLKAPIELFKSRFSKAAEYYTNQKIIDTLIWKFVTFLKSGAVRNRSVIFS